MAFRRVAAVTLAVAGISAATASSCVSTVLKEYALPSTPLSDLNPWLTGKTDYQALVAAGCDSCRDDGEVCYDKPALGSGLAVLRPGYLVGLTDRGPNQDCGDIAEIDPVKYADAVGKSGKGFPVKDFAPTMSHLKIGKDGLVVKKSVPLRGADGHPISGLPNTDADDTPYAAGCKGDPLSLDPSGLDTEDLAVIPGTDFVVIVDEYSPSVLVANVESGVISSRSVPSSVEAKLEGAAYKIVGDIPDVFTNRRKNRGFEAVVVDAEGKYALAIVQSPMLGPDDYAMNAIIRVAKFAITMTDGVPSLAYESQFFIEASPVSSYANTANVPKDMKYSGAVYTGVDEFVVLERGRGQVKLFTVNFADATNLDDSEFADNLNLEKASHEGKTAPQVSVVAAKKTLLWDSLKDVPAGTDNFSGKSKQEGFVIDPEDPTVMWMVADNDFGLEGNGDIILRKIKLGRSVSGSTICKKPAHPPAPSISVEKSMSIRLTNSQTYRISDEVGAGAAENFDVDEKARMAYVANDDTGAIDKYDLSAGPCFDAEPNACTFPEPVDRQAKEAPSCTVPSGDSTKCTKPGERCAGAVGYEYVEWLGCCSGECLPDKQKGWGRWCPEDNYSSTPTTYRMEEETCEGTASAPVVPVNSYTLADDFKPTSASVCKADGRVAAAFGGDEDETPGRIVVLSADLELEQEVLPDKDCFLPDHVRWSDDCAYLVVACEGEGAEIPGGVMVANFMEGQLRTATVAGFGGFDSQVDMIMTEGVRLVESKTPSLDWEPEYIAFVGQFAYVTLQEANAIAVVDLAEAVVSEIKPIGFIDRSKPGFGLDASNEDEGIHIINYPNVYGMPQPDTIQSYVAADGKSYLVIANEGDAKDDFEARGADLCDPEELNRTCSEELAALTSDDEALGRIKVTTVDGYNAETNIQEALFVYGGRSFSILALDGTVVFDSGEWMARIQSVLFPKIFNANGFDDEDLSKSQADLMDNRSDDKGGEVESLSLLTKGCTTYAFVGLERSSIIIVFDITVPTKPVFVDAVQNHPVDDPIEDVFKEGRQGDLDPEGLFASYRLGRLFVAGSVSNTISSYDIEGI